LAKRKIELIIDEELQTITINSEDETGKITRVVQGIAIFAGDAKANQLYGFCFGSSADAAWATKQLFVYAHSIVNNSKALINYFKQVAAHIAQAIDPAIFQNEISIKDVENRWLDNNQQNWFAQDSEDVLDDKTTAEEIKKKWH